MSIPLSRNIHSGTGGVGYKKDSCAVGKKNAVPSRLQREGIEHKHLQCVKLTLSANYCFASQMLILETSALEMRMDRKFRFGCKNVPRQMQNQQRKFRNRCKIYLSTGFLHLNRNIFTLTPHIPAPHRTWDA